jgi:hypothetical protein
MDILPYDGNQKISIFPGMKNTDFDQRTPEERLLDINIRWRRISDILLRLTSNFLGVLSKYVLQYSISWMYVVWYPSVILITGNGNSLSAL